MIEHGGNLLRIARERGWDWTTILDFSASINPLGPSPRVWEALRRALPLIPHYPEQQPARLQQALAEQWDVEPEQVFCGNGATDLIHFLARTLRPERVVLAQPTFSEFHRAFPHARFTPWEQPEAGPADWLVLTQPNNPHGRLHPEAFLLDCAGTVEMLLIDESFLDFTPARSLAARTRTLGNLLVLRSLTKFHALPGLRVGALVAPIELARRLWPLREPWTVNVLAEEAALAALADANHQDRSRQFVEEERAWLSQRLAELPGVHPQPSAANFLLLRVDNAPALAARLLDRRLLVRVIDNGSVRVAVRRREENQQLIAALQEVL